MSAALTNFIIRFECENQPSLLKKTRYLKNTTDTIKIGAWCCQLRAKGVVILTLLINNSSILNIFISNLRRESQIKRSQ